MMSPLPVNESFTIRCPLDVNPKPLIELLMQGRYRQVPSYNYSRSDNQSLIVTVGATRPALTFSSRKKKAGAIVFLAVILLLCQHMVVKKHQYQHLERNAVKIMLNKAETSERSLKMSKAFTDILRLPIYIRKVEVTPVGWSLDIMGNSTQIQTLSSRWKVIFPVYITQNGLTHIKEGGTWASK